MATKKERLLESVPRHAREKMINDKTKTVEEFYKGNEKEAYTKMQFARIYKGYDFLENMYLVRVAIQRKYDIEKVNLLEILLYLVPKNYFMLQDYRLVAHINYSYKKIEELMDRGYVSIASKGKAKTKNLYTTTAKARNIVQEYYEMLAGEIEIPTNALDKTECKGDKIKSRIIKEISKKTKPKTVQVLWARKIT